MRTKLNKFAQNLKAFRLKKSWSQVRLSKESTVSRLVIGRFEKGHGNPTRQTIEKLAKALEVTPDALYGEPEVPPRQKAVLTEEAKSFRDEISELQKEMLRGFGRLEALIEKKK